MNVDLVARVSMQSLPLPRLDDELLYDDLVVRQLQLDGKVRIKDTTLLADQIVRRECEQDGGQHEIAESSRASSQSRSA